MNIGLGLIAIPFVGGKLIKPDRIKKWSVFICTMVIMIITVTGCSMSYTSKELSQQSTISSWRVDFKSLNGDLAHSLSRKDGKPSTISVNSTVESGSLALQVQLGDKIEEIQKGERKVDLAKWDNGDFILRVVADNAQNGHVYFTWE